MTCKTHKWLLMINKPILVVYCQNCDKSFKPPNQIVPWLGKIAEGME